MKRLGLLAAVLLLCGLGSAEIMITVDPSTVLRRDAAQALGINLNYLRDDDANRPPASRPLRTALNDLGVRWLRYPGGEKSDFHRFAPPPYTKPAPIALGWYTTPVGTKMDFDAYIAVCRAQGAEPFVVVPCESQANSGATWDEQLAHAVGWVRYANIEKGYGVRYWEIGNENWHNNTAPAVEMAQHVVRVARAMRAVDPTIRLGASGNNRAWWDAFLPIAASELDVLTVSVYNCWGWKQYDRFLREPEPDLLNAAGDALRAIAALPEPERTRLRVIVSETNSVDYAEGGWPKTNTLGHALVTFETIGRFLREPTITAALLWNTRWVDDTEAPTNQFYALNATNDLLPAGQAVGLWGRHLRGDLLTVRGTSGHLRAHACADAAGRWTVWLVNRGLEPIAAVRVALGSLRSDAAVTAYAFQGQHPDDATPELTAPQSVVVTDGVLAPLTCPPLSITVITGGG